MTKHPIFLKSFALLSFGLCVIYLTTKVTSDKLSTAQPSFDGPVAPLKVSGPETSDGGSGDLALLREQMNSLQRELNSLRQQNLTKPKSAVPVTIPAVNEPQDLRRDPTAVAEAETARRGEMAIIESKFRNEPRNQQWATGAASQIRETLNTNQIPEDNLRNVECRSNTCRVELVNDQSGNMEKSLPLIINQLGATLPSMVADQIDQGNGVATTVLYLSSAP